MKIFEQIKLFYKDYFQPIPKNVWSSDCVRALVKRKYQAKEKVNKIAFLGYAVSPSFLHQLKGVMDELDSKDFDIVTVSLSNKAVNSEFIRYAEQRGIGLFSINDLIRKEISYKLVVMIDPPLSGVFYDEKSQKTVFGMQLIGEKFARMMFISGASNWMFNKTTSEVFDYIFVPGKYHKDKYDSLGIKAEVLALGSPRFDRVFKDKNDFYKEYNLDTSKQNFLWLPTHTNVSSFPDFIDIIAAMQDKFNIIFKAHDNLRLEISGIDEKLLSKIPNCKIVGSDVDSLDLINCSDIVACDYGGSIFSAINLDKKVLLFNTRNYDTLERVFGLDTPELMLREHIVNFNDDEQARVLNYISGDYNWEDQRKERSKIKSDFFSGKQGNVGQSIARYLQKVLVS